MDLPPAWSQGCICGRTFTAPQGYTNHLRVCKKTKTRLSSALDKARQIWQANKRRKTEAAQLEATGSRKMEDASLPDIHQQVGFSAMDLSFQHHSCFFFHVCQNGETSMDYEDLHQPLAARRTRREHRQLPKRYRDIPPVPAALPLSLQIMPECIPTESDVPQSPSQQCSVLASLPRKILKSTPNIFGLFRRYYATRFPDHDPDDLNMSTNQSSTPPVHSHGPYPNISSFLLGEWYWNDGERKSQSSFQQLLKIVGHPDFHPEDVAGQNWRLIDAQLSGARCDGSNKKDDWEDEQPNWIKTPIRINVPFHKGMLHPGQKEFDAGVLHHRKLTSVIRERITRPSMQSHLHFEPYELFWQPNVATEPVRVHGELYTSEAFIEAHNKLQDSPPEPECDLPRVVLGLMFASDSTQLTSFSTAELWPVYLTIGNESKDRRSKPSCHAFEHIAYLETARETTFVEYYMKLMSSGTDSFLMPLRPSQQMLVARDLAPHLWAIVVEKSIMPNGRSSSTMIS